jgi:hypothetical protein
MVVTGDHSAIVKCHAHRDEMRSVHSACRMEPAPLADPAET